MKIKIITIIISSKIKNNINNKIVILIITKKTIIKKIIAKKIISIIQQTKDQKDLKILKDKIINLMHQWNIGIFERI